MGQSALRRFRLAPSDADLFTDPVAGYVYPKVESVEEELAIKAYERNYARADHEAFDHALGERESALKFSTEGIGFGLSPAGAGDGVTAADGENGLLLKSVFGTQVKQAGGTIATGTTTAAVQTTANWAVGTFLGIVDPATGLFHVRQIRAKSGGPTYTYTLDRVLPIDPADASVVYASATYYHAVSGHQHLWFDVEGYDATPANGWRRYIRGCLGDVALKNLAANGKLAFEWSFKGVDWSDAGQGSAQTAPTYPSNLPADGAFIRNTRLSVGASALVVAELGFTLANDVQPKPSTAATNGIASFQVVGYKPQITFKIAESDAETAGLRAAWKAKTMLDVLVELTQGGPGNSFAIAAPRCQIVEYKRSVLGGLDYRDVVCAVKDSGITNVPSVAFGVL